MDFLTKTTAVCHHGLLNFIREGTPKFQQFTTPSPEGSSDPGDYKSRQLLQVFTMRTWLSQEQQNSRSDVQLQEEFANLLQADLGVVAVDNESFRLRHGIAQQFPAISDNALQGPPRLRLSESIPTIPDVPLSPHVANIHTTWLRTHSSNAKYFLKINARGTGSNRLASDYMRNGSTVYYGSQAVIQQLMAAMPQGQAYQCINAITIIAGGRIPLAIRQLRGTAFDDAMDIWIHNGNNNDIVYAIYDAIHNIKSGKYTIVFVSCQHGLQRSLTIGRKLFGRGRCVRVDDDITNQIQQPINNNNIGCQINYAQKIVHDDTSRGRPTIPQHLFDANGQPLGDFTPDEIAVWNAVVSDAVRTAPVPGTDEREIVHEGPYSYVNRYPIVTMLQQRQQETINNLLTGLVHLAPTDHDQVKLVYVDATTQPEPGCVFINSTDKNGAQTPLLHSTTQQLMLPLNDQIRAIVGKTLSAMNRNHGLSQGFIQKGDSDFANVFQKFFSTSLGKTFRWQTFNHKIGINNMELEYLDTDSPDNKLLTRLCAIIFWLVRAPNALQLISKWIQAARAMQARARQAVKLRPDDPETHFTVCDRQRFFAQLQRDQLDGQQTSVLHRICSNGSYQVRKMFNAAQSATGQTYISKVDTEDTMYHASQILDHKNIWLDKYYHANGDPMTEQEQFDILEESKKKGIISASDNRKKELEEYLINYPEGSMDPNAQNRVAIKPVGDQANRKEQLQSRNSGLLGANDPAEQPRIYAYKTRLDDWCGNACFFRYGPSLKQRGTIHVQSNSFEVFFVTRFDSEYFPEGVKATSQAGQVTQRLGKDELIYMQDPLFWSSVNLGAIRFDLVGPMAAKKNVRMPFCSNVDVYQFHFNDRVLGANGQDWIDFTAPFTLGANKVFMTYLPIEEVSWVQLNARGDKEFSEGNLRPGTRAQIDAVHLMARSITEQGSSGAGVVHNISSDDVTESANLQIEKKFRGSHISLQKRKVVVEDNLLSKVAVYSTEDFVINPMKHEYMNTCNPLSYSLKKKEGASYPNGHAQSKWHQVYVALNVSVKLKLAYRKTVVLVAPNPQEFKLILHWNKQVKRQTQLFDDLSTSGCDMRGCEILWTRIGFTPRDCSTDLKELNPQFIPFNDFVLTEGAHFAINHPQFDIHQVDNLYYMSGIQSPNNPDGLMEKTWQTQVQYPNEQGSKHFLDVQCKMRSEPHPEAPEVGFIICRKHGIFDYYALGNEKIYTNTFSMALDAEYCIYRFGKIAFQTRSGGGQRDDCIFIDKPHAYVEQQHSDGTVTQKPVTQVTVQVEQILSVETKEVSWILPNTVHIFSTKWISHQTGNLEENQGVEGTASAKMNTYTHPGPGTVQFASMLMQVQKLSSHDADKLRKTIKITGDNTVNDVAEEYKLVVLAIAIQKSMDMAFTVKAHKQEWRTGLYQSTALKLAVQYQGWTGAFQAWFLGKPFQGHKVKAMSNEGSMLQIRVDGSGRTIDQIDTAEWVVWLSTVGCYAHVTELLLFHVFPAVRLGWITDLVIEYALGNYLQFFFGWLYDFGSVPTLIVIWLFCLLALIPKLLAFEQLHDIPDYANGSRTSRFGALTLWMKVVGTALIVLEVLRYSATISYGPDAAHNCMHNLLQWSQRAWEGRYYETFIPSQGTLDTVVEDTWEDWFKTSPYSVLPPVTRDLTKIVGGSTLTYIVCWTTRITHRFLLALSATVKTILFILEIVMTLIELVIINSQRQARQSAKDCVSSNVRKNVNGTLELVSFPFSQQAEGKNETLILEALDDLVDRDRALELLASDDVVQATQLAVSVQSPEEVASKKLEMEKQMSDDIKLTYLAGDFTSIAPTPKSAPKESDLHQDDTQPGESKQIRQRIFDDPQIWSNVGQSVNSITITESRPAISSNAIQKQNARKCLHWRKMKEELSRMKSVFQDTSTGPNFREGLHRVQVEDPIQQRTDTPQLKVGGYVDLSLLGPYPHERPVYYYFSNDFHTTVFALINRLFSSVNWAAVGGPAYLCMTTLADDMPEIPSSWFVKTVTAQRPVRPRHSQSVIFIKMLMSLIRGLRDCQGRKAIYSIPLLHAEQEEYFEETPSDWLLCGLSRTKREGYIRNFKEFIERSTQNISLYPEYWKRISNEANKPLKWSDAVTKRNEQYALLAAAQARGIANPSTTLRFIDVYLRREWQAQVERVRRHAKATNDMEAVEAIKAHDAKFNCQEGGDFSKPTVEDFYQVNLEEVSEIDKIFGLKKSKDEIDNPVLNHEAFSKIDTPHFLTLKAYLLNRPENIKLKSLPGGGVEVLINRFLIKLFPHLNEKKDDMHFAIGQNSRQTKRWLTRKINKLRERLRKDGLSELLVWFSLDGKAWDSTMSELRKYDIYFKSLVDRDDLWEWLQGIAEREEPFSRNEKDAILEFTFTSQVGMTVGSKDKICEVIMNGLTQSGDATGTTFGNSIRNEAVMRDILGSVRKYVLHQAGGDDTCLMTSIDLVHMVSRLVWVNTSRDPHEYSHTGVVFGCDVPIPKELPASLEQWKKDGTMNAQVRKDLDHAFGRETLFPYYEIDQPFDQKHFGDFQSKRYYFHLGELISIERPLDRVIGQLLVSDHLVSFNSVADKDGFVDKRLITKAEAKWYRDKSICGTYEWQTFWAQHQHSGSTDSNRSLCWNLQTYNLNRSGWSEKQFIDAQHRGNLEELQNSFGDNRHKLRTGDAYILGWNPEQLDPEPRKLYNWLSSDVYYTYASSVVPLKVGGRYHD